MISGIFWEGSGIGNQLHRYVAVRTMAKKLGYHFGMKNTHLFKAKFIDLDLLEADELTHTFQEKKVVENGVDIRGYDPEVNFIKDGTLVDGEFQDERYFDIMDVRAWLKTEPIEMPDDLCVIGFRGGEYVGVKDLFLPKEYWDEAIAMMRKGNPDMRFEVHTDDPETARHFFDFPIVHDAEQNWKATRYAKHLIIANSSFYILPALMNETADIIAPRYWARRNTGVWGLPQNYYSRFHYI